MLVSVFGSWGSARSDLGAAALMLAAVFLYSLLPLLVVLAGGRESPWLFVFLRRVGMALGMMGYLALRQPGFLLDREVWRRVLGRLAGRHMLFTLLAMADMLCFVLAARLVSISVVTVLAQGATLCFVLLMGRLDGGGLYRRVTPSVVVLLALGLGGFGLVVVSGQGGGGHLLSRGVLSQSAGVCLALLSAFVGGFNAYCFSLGRLLAVEHDADDSTPVWGASVDLSFCYVLLCSSLAQGVSALLHSPVALAEAFLWGGGMSGGAVCTNLASGVLVFSAAGVLNRRANIMTSNLGVNALGYLGPAVSVGLLAASGAVGLAPWGAEVSRPGVFVVGLAVVLLVNLLVNLRSGR